MNVYDFDNTIYRGDSTFQFVLWLYVHRPLTLLSVPRTAVCGLLYALHIMKKLTFKQNLYHMFVFVKDMEKAADAFADSHMDRIKTWYLQQQREDDLVISASPEFLISRFCRRADIRSVMASRVDMHSGRYSGLNCHGAEKVRRFRKRFSDKAPQGFWSDSLSDSPLACISEKAWIVRGDQRTAWPEKALDEARVELARENLL